MKLQELLVHPLVALSVVGSAALSLLPGAAPVWEFVGATAGTWFPLVAVSASTILPELGFKNIGTTVLLAAAVVYVAVYLDRFIGRLEEFIKS